MSLVTTASSSLASCYACGSQRVTSLSMTLTDGSLVEFESCHQCESRAWSQGGQRLPLDSVLQRARKNR